MALIFIATNHAEWRHEHISDKIHIKTFSAQIALINATLKYVSCRTVCVCGRDLLLLGMCEMVKKGEKKVSKYFTVNLKFQVVRAFLLASVVISSAGN